MTRKRRSGASRSRFSGAGDVRGLVVQAPRSPFVLALGVTSLGAVLYLLLRGSKMSVLGKAFDFAKSQAFAAALPSTVGRYATQILNAASTYNVNPWVLAGIMYRESLGGAALTPANDPGGTGDFTPRWSGLYAKYANPATGLPPDGKGWGRGLMQIDYGVHNAWILANNWADPQTNINKAAQIFAEHLNYFARQPTTPTVAIECWRITNGMPQIKIAPWREKYPNARLPACTAGAKYASPLGRDIRPLSGAKLYEAALASYNAGTSGVLQALGVGLPAEAATAHQDYVSWFTSRLGSWTSKF